MIPVGGRIGSLGGSSGSDPSDHARLHAHDAADHAPGAASTAYATNEAGTAVLELPYAKGPVKGALVKRNSIAAQSRGHIEAIRIWRELLLVINQMFGAGTVREAMLFGFKTANYADGETFTMFDGATTEVFTFKTVPAIAFEVLIGASIDDTIDNLATQMGIDSALWIGFAKTNLDAWFPGVTTTRQLVIIRQNGGLNLPDRAFTTLSAGNRYFHSFNQIGDYGIAVTAATEMLAVDPTVRYSGFGHSINEVIPRQTHRTTDSSDTWFFNTGSALWSRTFGYHFDESHFSIEPRNPFTVSDLVEPGDRSVNFQQNLGSGDGLGGSDQGALGGQNTRMDSASARAATLGGFNAEFLTSADAVNVGGQNNSFDGAGRSFLAACTSQLADGPNGFGAGRVTEVGDRCAVIGPDSKARSVGGESSYAIGSRCDTGTGRVRFATGRDVKLFVNGMKAHGVRRFATQGDCQVQKAYATGTTVNGNVNSAEANLTANFQRYKLQPNQALNVLWCAVCHTADNEKMGFWDIRQMKLYKKAAGAAVEIVGGNFVSYAADDPVDGGGGVPAGLSIRMARSTNEFKIELTGENGETYHWQIYVFAGIAMIFN